MLKTSVTKIKNTVERNNSQLSRGDNLRMVDRPSCLHPNINKEKYYPSMPTVSRILRYNPEPKPNIRELEEGAEINVKDMENLLNDIIADSPSLEKQKRHLNHQIFRFSSRHDHRRTPS